MALKALLDKLDGVDEATQALYKEANGKFVLDVEAVGGYALEDITGLKKVKDEAISGRDTLKGQLNESKIELTALKKSNAELKAGQSGELDERINTLKAELEELHSTEQKVLANERDSLQSELESTLFNSSLKDVLAELGATNNGLRYLPGEIKPHVKFTREGDKYTVNVVDANGNIRSSKDKPGENMSVAELVKSEIAPNNKELFLGNQQSGSGASGLNGGSGVAFTGKTISQTEFQALDPKARADLLVDPKTGEATGIQVEN